MTHLLNYKNSWPVHKHNSKLSPPFSVFRYHKKHRKPKEKKKKMVGASPGHASGAPKRLTLGFLISVSSFVTRFAKQASHFSIKYKAKPIKNNSHAAKQPIKSNANMEYYNNSNNKNSIPPSPKSPLSARPKQLITRISNKAITLIHKRKIDEDKDDDVVFGGSHDEFGDGGVWQRAILMGDKCQPLDFSGVIYYDSTGKQLEELPPRSPRASPLPGYLARK